MDTEALVPAFTTTNLMEAELLRNVVLAEGIRCELDNSHQAGLAGILEIKGLVQTSDEVRARLALAKHNKRVYGLQGESVADPV
jgi:hypothetical protein